MIEKDAVQYLMEQGINPESRIVNLDREDNGERWVVIDNEGIPHELQPRVFLACTLYINTLSGFVNYIKADLERKGEPLLVQICSEKEVYLKGLLEINGQRETLAVAEAIVPSFSFDTFIDSESFVIAFQSKFVKNEDRDILLQVMGNVAEENIKKTGDDGISQSVEVRQGVATKAEVLVPNPVKLAPYRTFLEVPQPESQFVFRMKDGPRGAIFEADGGAWRNQAIENIRQYLAKELTDQVKDGRITILA